MFQQHSPQFSDPSGSRTYTSSANSCPYMPLLKSDEGSAAISSVLVSWHAVQVKVRIPFHKTVGALVTTPSSQTWPRAGVVSCGSANTRPHRSHFSPADRPGVVQVASVAGTWTGLWPSAGTSVWYTTVSPQRSHVFPSVRPGWVHVGETPGTTVVSLCGHLTICIVFRIFWKRAALSE